MSFSGPCIPAMSGTYQQFGYRGKTMYYHRVAYEMVKGPIPEGMEIDHVCSNKSCWNPDHLEAVTSGENKRRAYARGEQPSQMRDTCGRGHPWEWVSTNKRTGRRIVACFTCRKEKRREAKHG